jgi:NADH:ubiquinone oxidoreductase subunit 5 (subunit L)/multisubunit Na+/H+ antiporter MnhA subunit
MSYIIGSLPGIVGIGLALVMYLFVPAISSAISSVAWPLERLFAGKYFIDELYDRSIVRPLTGISQALSRGINQTFVEGSGNAVGIVTRAVGELTCRATSGQVATYVLIMFGAIAFLLSVFVKV